MVVDIFYPLLTLKITILACFIQKKSGDLPPPPPQTITLDTLVGLQLPSIPPAAKKKQCTHIFF